MISTWRCEEWCLGSSSKMRTWFTPDFAQPFMFRPSNPRIDWYINHIIVVSTALPMRMMTSKGPLYNRVTMFQSLRYWNLSQTSDCCKRFSLEVMQICHQKSQVVSSGGIKSNDGVPAYCVVVFVSRSSSIWSSSGITLGWERELHDYRFNFWYLLCYNFKCWMILSVSQSMLE